jgi:hypothetical protein
MSGDERDAKRSVGNYLRDARYNNGNAGFVSRPADSPTVACFAGPKSLEEQPMSDKPTPGPWRWVYDDLVDAAGKDVLHVDPGWQTECTEEPPSLRVSEVNKRLIAKAPELASMLRELEWSGGGGYEEPVCCPECSAEPKAFTGDPRPGCGMHYPDCRLAALLRELP